MPLAKTRLLPRLPRAWLSFDGVDDYVVIPDSPSLNITTGITIIARLKATQRLTAFTDIIEKTTGDCVTGERGYLLTFYDGTPGISVKYCNVFPDPIFDPHRIVDGKFHIVAGTADGSYIRFFIDENKVAEVQRDYLPHDSSGGDLAVNPRRSFKGYISQILIYNRGISEFEINWNRYHPLEPVKDGLVLWLDETSIDVSAGLWRDKSGYGNDGVIYGAVKETRSTTPVRVLTPTRILPSVR